MEHMRRIAYETVLRACGFGSLAIFCVMIGMSFEPRAAFQAGGTLTTLMASTATIIVGGIPAALYERFIGAKDDSTVVSLWIWLAGTALLTLPAIGNFFQIGL